MNELVVRPLTEADRSQWADLFEQYRSFCGRDANPDAVDQAWQWITDPDHHVRGIAAMNGDAVAGIAHFRSFSRTVDGNEGLHLDDLFIAEEFRGNGTAREILEYLDELAGLEQVEFVRWVTAEDNTSAQRLYDRVAERTSWVTYEQRPTRRNGSEAVNRTDAALEAATCTL